MQEIFNCVVSFYEHFLSFTQIMLLQGETVRINTSFTAYVTEGEPSLIDEPTHLTLDRNLIIPDDHKEYVMDKQLYY